MRSPWEDAWACAPICEKALAVLTVLNDNYRSKKGNIHCSPRFKFNGNGGAGDNINKQLKDATYNRQHLLNLIRDYSKHIDICYEPDSMDDVYRLVSPSVPKQYNPIIEREDGGFYWRFSLYVLVNIFIPPDNHDFASSRRCSFILNQAK